MTERRRREEGEAPHEAPHEKETPLTRRREEGEAPHGEAPHELTNSLVLISEIRDLSSLDRAGVLAQRGRTWVAHHGGRRGRRARRQARVPEFRLVGRGRGGWPHRQRRHTRRGHEGPRARVRGIRQRPLVGCMGDGMLFARVLPACHSARSAGNAHGLSGAVLAFVSRPALTDASRRGVSPCL